VPIEIALKGLHNLPLQAYGQIFYSKDGVVRALQAETDSRGRLKFAVDTWSEMQIVFYGGYWTLVLDPKHFPPELACPVLPSCGARMWWHAILGLDTPDPAAGENLTIGVVDTPFPPTAGLEHVVVQNLAGGPCREPLGTLPSHGETVCRLIGQRMEDPMRFGGVAPAAKLICISAERDAVLNNAMASAAIVKLAREFHCDIINLSAGCRRQPTEGLRQAISEAREYGALCVVAAGNEPDPQVSYPARYPESIAVGAIGLRNWGPIPSFVRLLSDWASSEADMLGKVGDFDVFHYPKSAYGEGLDVVGPGVGLIIHRGAEPIFDAIGTSFASPLVAGLLAVILGKSKDYRRLPRGPERAAFAERMLRAVCHRTGMGISREGNGLPRLPSKLLLPHIN
jgi:subtilisin